MLLLLTDRAPIPLFQFLCLHEQPNLGFHSLETVARMSAINLQQVTYFDIVSNKITFVNNAPKVFYKLVLKYRPHSALPGDQQANRPLNEEEVITYKQFSDFKQLDLIIKLTCFRLDEYGSYMPILPQKRYAMSGNKKTGDELQNELVEYVNDLLKIKQLQRMFYFRLFLCDNAYHNISDETFNEATGNDMLAQTNDFELGGPSQTGMLRESEDISNLVNFNSRQFAQTAAAAQQQYEDDMIAFETSPIVQPSNL